jgi:pimeloyl-ACP methyl ester carboxylesterase
MVLVHGIGGEHCVWEPLLEPLGARYEVIAVDLPGFGSSPPLAEHVTPTPEALAAAVAGFLDEQGIERAHLVGNSLGGWVALELAKLGRGRSVTALCPAGLWGRPLLADGDMARSGAQRLARRLRWLLPVLLASRRLRRLALRAFVADPDRVPYHAAWRMVRGYARATAYDATNNAMRRAHFTGAERIEVPVTLAFGEHDRLVRPARVAGVPSVILPGCGHIPMWDDAPLVLDLIEQTAQLTGVGPPGQVSSSRLRTGQA